MNELPKGGKRIAALDTLNARVASSAVVASETGFGSVEPSFCSILGPGFLPKAKRVKSNFGAYESGSEYDVMHAVRSLGAACALSRTDELRLGSLYDEEQAIRFWACYGRRRRIGSLMRERRAWPCNFDKGGVRADPNIAHQIR